MNHIARMRQLILTSKQGAEECRDRSGPRTQAYHRLEGQRIGLNTALLLIKGYCRQQKPDLEQTENDAKKYHKLLEEAVALIEGLADQQAMPDDFYKPGLERIKRCLAKRKKRT